MWVYIEAVCNALLTGIYQESATYSLDSKMGYIKTCDSGGTLRQYVILFLLEFTSTKQKCVGFFPGRLFSGSPNGGH